MSEKRGEHQPAKGVEFILNEPVKPIPGGTRRESVEVDLKAYPQIQRRLRLNRLLLAHDPEVAEESLAELGEGDLPVLRRMAQETILSGNEPMLRRNAISALGRFPNPENLNLLAQLARYGEDLYVRGAALAALADTGISMVLPVLKEGLAARDPIEYQIAQQGLVRLGAVIGSGPIEELLVRERRGAVRSGVSAALNELAQEVPTRVRRERQTTALD